MIETAAAASVRAAAWQGWIRAGSGFPPGASAPRAGRLDLGAAVFSLPEPGEARTTSWARADGRFGIFSGFLFNRRQLARELQFDEPDGESLGLPSPAELLLAGYRRWGCDVVKQVEGVFAWCIWDEPNELLLCGRDPVGWHPFFYSLAGRELIFSWDLEGVRSHPRVPRRLNPVALGEHLTHHLTDPHETVFEGVRRLPGGHALKFCHGRCEVFRYFDPLPLAGTVRWVDDEELAEFPRLLEEAVTRVMECGNGRTGILLSGGLDSVSVAAFAAQVAADKGWPRPRAYSVVFPDQAFEKPVQEGIAQRLGFPQTFADLVDYVEGPGLLRSALEPAARLPAPPTFVFSPPFVDLLKLAKSEGCEVALTGNGGDELLTVTPAWAADLIVSGHWAELARQVKLLLRFWQAPAHEILRAILWTWGTRAVIRDWVWRHASPLAQPFRRRLLSKALPPWVVPDPALRRELISRFEERFDKQIGQGTFYLAHANMYLLDPRANMIEEEQFYRNLPTGVLTMHPYWYPRLADFLLRIRPETLTAGSQSKSLIRNMLAERFPQLGFERQKKVVSIDFPRTVFARELPGLWAELGPARQMGEMGLVDPKRYQEKISGTLRSRRGRGLYDAWHGATVEAWSRLHA